MHRGVARYAGGAIAVTIYLSILANVQASSAAVLVPAAAMAAGASSSTAEAVLAALPLGSKALMAVKGINLKIATAAGGAFVEIYVKAVR